MKERTFTGTTDPTVQPYETAHREVARKAAADSVVVLKNDGHLLPVAPSTPIALYGAGAGHTIKGGTGSGDVNERYSVTIAEGLKQAGYIITTQDWIDAYDRVYKEARQAWKDAIWAECDKRPGGAIEMFMVYSSMPFEVPAGPVEAEKTEADIAVYVLSRVAGEGADRYAKKGDYYLSDEEEELLGNICAVYPKVVLVLNAGGQMDLSFTDQYPNIAAILQIAQLGCEGGNGFADVFSGKVAPAGKLTGTWAYKYEDYPNSATFSHNNGDVENELYTEGIYVGYRYFDTFEVPVRYGFGYGLGYTDFSVKTTGLMVYGKEEKKPEIGVKVAVTNTGDSYEGREIVQVYASCPQDKMPKEYRRLVGFAKTEPLKPGESQEMEIRFTAYDLASYCEKTPGWVLEAGTYGIFVGDSLENAAFAGSVQVEEDEILVKTEHICPLQTELEELQGPAEKIAARRAAWLPEAAEAPSVTLGSGDFAAETVVYGTEYDKIPDKVKEFVDSLTEDQLIRLATGDPGQGMLASNLGSAGISVPGSAAQSNGCAKDQGLSDIVFADGPAGLRLNQSYYVKDGKVVQEAFEKGLEGGFLCRIRRNPRGRSTISTARLSP